MIKYKIYCISWLCLIGCNLSQFPRKAEYLDHKNRQYVVSAENGGVACAHPLASKVGLYILQKGGNAVDAAIAMQLALAVVYPQAGNIGGGGFMTLRLSDGTVKTLDFRETAPAAASKNMYLDSVGNVIRGKSTEGPLAAGIPGTVAGIFESMRYARLSFKELIQPAIELAEQGYDYRVDYYKISSKYNTLPNAFDGHIPYQQGERFIQPDLAATLKRIRNKGVKGFYEGRTAELIVAEMKRGGGIITYADLKNYRAKWREPQHFTYRGYDIYTMPLPSSGGILLQQMLKMVEPYPLGKYGDQSTQTIQLIIEAERRAFKDRSTYLGDADFNKIPVAALVSDAHINELMKDMAFGTAGKSTPIENELLMPQESKETTHLSVVDKEGNAVSVTTTLNGPYGSQTIVGGAGFFLNNEMNDFAIKIGNRSGSGGIGGKYNLIEPGKRMLSSMTPTIICKDGVLFMVVGTPGGTTIPTSVFQAIIGVVDMNKSAAEAVNAPKIHHEWMPDEIMMETGRYPADTIKKLRNMGYKISGSSGSSLEMILRIDRSYQLVSQRGSAEGY